MMDRDMLGNTMWAGHRLWMLVIHSRAQHTLKGNPKLH